MQLELFAADRYHDPRVAAARSRARSLAKLQPVRRPAPVERGAGGASNVHELQRGSIQPAGPQQQRRAA